MSILREDGATHLGFSNLGSVSARLMGTVNGENSAPIEG